MASLNKASLLNSMDRILLDQVKVGMQQVLCDYPSIIHNMKVEGYVNRFHDMGLHVAYNFVSYLSEIKKQDKTTAKLYSYPATPWDFLKEKYAPKWFLGRWPVKYSTKEVEVLSEKHFMCPPLGVIGQLPACHVDEHGW